MLQNHLKYSPKPPQTFTGKERDSETGFSYFGARYYDSDLMTGWLSVDPLADDFSSISPYNYCNWNPVKLKDPNGEVPWIIIGGILLDYGFQVYENYSEGKSGWQAFSDVNLLSIALSAVDLGKIKTVTNIGKFIKVGGEIAIEAASNAVDINPNNGVSITTDVTEIATKTAAAQFGSDIGKLANTQVKKATEGAVRKADKEVNRVQSRINHAQQKNTNTPSQKTSSRLDKAKSEGQAARNNQVLTKMAKSAVDKFGPCAPPLLKYIAKNGVPDDKNGKQ